MARYTDIDKLIAEYDRVHIGPAGGARKLMIEAPIADVVPRAEVEKIFEEIEKYTYRYLNDAHYIMGDMILDIAELKKKYTERSRE